MRWPDAFASHQWLISQGLDDALASQALLANGGRPQDALAYAQSGLDPAAWSGFSKAMARGDVGWVRDWSPPELLATQQKLCHDLLAVCVGAAPRYFAASDLVPGPSLWTLSQWSQALSAQHRTIEHPFNPGLLLESLVSQAQRVMSSSSAAVP